MLFFVILWAIGINWLAYRKGFFKLPKLPQKSNPQVTLLQLVICFCIYLLISLVVGPIFARYLLLFLNQSDPEISSLPIAALTAIQFLSMTASFLLLQVFMRGQDQRCYSAIWKNRALTPSKPIEFDFATGTAVWFLSFPVATAFAELVDKLVRSTYGLSHYEQTAVKFVKAATSSPFALAFAMGSVLLLAPLIEEFLFRGVLLNFFKKHLGAMPAILLSSLLFGLFHFYPSQGMGNLSLITALFLLGCYLGFIYERQQSLWASIGLHLTFNLISALRILLLPEAS